MGRHRTTAVSCQTGQHQADALAALLVAHGVLIHPFGSRMVIAVPPGVRLKGSGAPSRSSPLARSLTSRPEVDALVEGPFASGPPVSQDRRERARQTAARLDDDTALNCTYWTHPNTGSLGPVPLHTSGRRFDTVRAHQCSCRSASFREMACSILAFC